MRSNFSYVQNIYLTPLYPPRTYITRASAMALKPVICSCSQGGGGGWGVGRWGVGRWGGVGGGVGGWGWGGGGSGNVSTSVIPHTYICPPLCCNRTLTFVDFSIWSSRWRGFYWWFMGWFPKTTGCRGSSRSYCSPNQLVGSNSTLKEAIYARIWR